MQKTWLSHTFVKPAVLQYCYKDPTGDSSSSETSSQEQIDERKMQVIEIEDHHTHIVLDLRNLIFGTIS